MDKGRLAEVSKILLDCNTQEVGGILRRALQRGMYAVPEINEVMAPLVEEARGMGPMSAVEVAFRLFLLIEMNNGWEALLRETKEQTIGEMVVK